MEKRRDNTVFLLIVIMFLIVGMVVLWVVKDSEIYRTTVPVCTSEHVTIDLSEPNIPSIFSDLTQKEIENAMQILKEHTNLNLQSGANVSVQSTYVFTIEVLLPKKSDVLKFLDDYKPKPERFAKAVVFRGNLPEPKVEEYVIGPLQNSTNDSSPVIVTVTKTIPFAFRPLSSVELLAMEKVILPLVDLKAENVLLESFGAKFINCSRRCLSYYYSPVSTSNYNKLTRNIWLHVTHFIEYHSLHPLEFHLLVNLDGTDPQNYRIVQVSYNAQNFNSLEDFVAKFEKGMLQKIHIQFPEVNEDLYSSLNLRGVPFPKEPSRRPFQLEPDGKRYKISGQRVHFMEWTYHYRMSTTNGPMLFDVRFKQNRIAYEISLQEIAALTIGKIPLQQNNNFETSSGILGTASRGLVPGADCPEHATFLPARHLVEGSISSTVFQNALCLFEQETGKPLRRHHSFSKMAGKFYGGMSDDVLVMRTILAVANYDYVIDFVFHLNGVLEVKFVQTGFVLARYNFNGNTYSGFQIQDKIASDIHYHSLNFKIDLDIRGRKNSFSTIEPEILPSDTPMLNDSKEDRFTTVIKQSEQQAKYGFRDEMPKYLLFHNENEKNKYGYPRAYRLHLSETHRASVPKMIGNKNSVSWLSYKLAVTKYKRAESCSSSPYSAWDAVKPSINFESFVEDDDIIKNEVCFAVHFMIYVNKTFNADYGLLDTSVLAIIYIYFYLYLQFKVVLDSHNSGHIWLLHLIPFKMPPHWNVMSKTPDMTSAQSPRVEALFS